jgi:hypothetical protein
MSKQLSEVLRDGRMPLGDFWLDRHLGDFSHAAACVLISNDIDPSDSSYQPPPHSLFVDRQIVPVPVVGRHAAGFVSSHPSHRSPHPDRPECVHREFRAVFDASLKVPWVRRKGAAAHSPPATQGESGRAGRGLILSRELEP